MHEHEHEHAIGGEYMSLRSFELRGFLLHQCMPLCTSTIHILRAYIGMGLVCMYCTYGVHRWHRLNYTPSFELLYISHHSNYCTRIIVTYMNAVTQFHRPQYVCSDTPKPPLKKPIYVS